MKTLGKGRLGKIWALLAATGAFALVTAGVAMPASADTPAAYLNPTETTLVCVHEQTRIQVVADVVVPDGAPATTVTVTGTDANGGVALTFAPSPQTAASSGKYTFTAPINRNSNSFTYNVHLDGVTFGSGGVNGAPPQDCGVPEKPDTPPASTTEPTSEWADVDPPEVDYVNETKKQVRDLTTTDYEWVLVDNEWVESVVDTTTTQEYRWVDADDYELGGGPRPTPDEPVIGELYECVDADDPPVVDENGEVATLCKQDTTTYTVIARDGVWVQDPTVTTAENVASTRPATDDELNPDSGGGTTDPGDNPDNGGGTPDDGENPDDGGDQPTDPGNTPDDDSDDTPVGGDDSSSGDDTPTGSSDDTTDTTTKDATSKGEEFEVKGGSDWGEASTDIIDDGAGFSPQVAGATLAGFGAIVLLGWFLRTRRTSRVQ